MYFMSNRRIPLVVFFEEGAVDEEGLGSYIKSGSSGIRLLVTIKKSILLFLFFIFSFSLLLFFSISSKLKTQTL